MSAELRKLDPTLKSNVYTEKIKVSLKDSMKDLNRFAIFVGGKTQYHKDFKSSKSFRTRAGSY